MWYVVLYAVAAEECSISLGMCRFNKYTKTADTLLPDLAR